MSGEQVSVVGGGVIGLSVARELLRRDCRVTVLHRGDSLAGVSTPAAAGMLAPVSEVELQDEPLLHLGFDSLARYPRFVAELGADCGFRRDGTLWVAFSRDDLDELDHLRGTLEARGLSAEPIDATRLLELEPHLGSRVQGGLRVDLQIDPRALLRVLERAVLEAGGTIESGVTVREIVVDGTRVRALRCESADAALADRPVSTVVLAAGAWSCEAIRSPLTGAGVRPVKGQLLRLRGARLLRHVIRHPEVYLVPRSDGELLVGATMEEQGFDVTPTAGAVHDLLRKASIVLPGLYDLALEEINVGLRPISRDNRPLLGPTACDGLFAACGHGRQGVLLAPATAHYVAEAVVSGRIDPALEPFGVERGRAEVSG